MVLLKTSQFRSFGKVRKYAVLSRCHFWWAFWMRRLVRVDCLCFPTAEASPYTEFSVNFSNHSGRSQNRATLAESLFPCFQCRALVCPWPHYGSALSLFLKTQVTDVARQSAQSFPCCIVFYCRLIDEMRLLTTRSARRNISVLRRVVHAMELAWRCVLEELCCHE